MSEIEADNQMIVHTEAQGDRIALGISVDGTLYANARLSPAAARRVATALLRDVGLLEDGIG